MRKFRRIYVRYGHPLPLHQAVAQKITTKGLFLLTNGAVYSVGSPIAIEIRGPADAWVARGVVRHAFKAPPSLATFTNPGMGVEFTDVPDACREYLASL
ncbi:MAG TPA: hypothetical protein VI078_13290 [bacterium]